MTGSATRPKLCALATRTAFLTESQIDRSEGRRGSAGLARIEASTEVQALTRRLRLHVAIQPRKDADWIDRPSVTLEVSDVGERKVFWPVDIPVVPQDPSAPPELFQIVAEALDGQGCYGTQNAPTLLGLRSPKTISLSPAQTPIGLSLVGAPSEGSGVQRPVEGS